jgi:hypothetical protein
MLGEKLAIGCRRVDPPIISYPDGAITADPRRTVAASFDRLAIRVMHNSRPVGSSAELIAFSPSDHQDWLRHIIPWRVVTF